tara:strand:+ start:313 stop:1614 length:1302 start_codon:yes stop_codon:yes gene_type:complete
VKKNNLYSLAKKLFPINRSITGEGVRSTLKILKNINHLLKIYEIRSGTKVFDWKIPLEWNVKDAWIKDAKDKKIIDFKKNNLHLMSYSIPVNKSVKFDELKKHLYFHNSRPNAIPYVTSYYKKKWGFCLSKNQLRKLKNETYKVKIDSNFKKGSLTYGEIFIPGRLKKEIFLSTYICHPSLANNEVSGPCVAIFISNWIKKITNRKYSYRIIFIPETIGSIAYLSKNYKKMKKNILAGYNLTCLGDDRTYSYLPSRAENTISDKIAKHVLKWKYKKYKRYKWTDRGSDERQYCSPGIDLPIATICRSKFAEYPEYHTSDDNLKKVVSAKGLLGSFEIYKEVITAIEKNCFPKVKTLGEPMLSKRNIYPLELEKNNQDFKNYNFLMGMHFLSYCDGKHSLLDIAEKCEEPIWNLYKYLEIYKFKKIITTRNILN